MTRRFWLTSVLVGAVAAAVACSRHSAAPASPSSSAVVASNAAADGSTLKAPAPTLQSPIKGVKLDPGASITLVVANATPKFANIPLSYRFQVLNASGSQVLYDSSLVSGGSSGTTSHVVTVTLDGDQTYQWQARAEYNGAFSPWSARESFVASFNDVYI